MSLRPVCIYSNYVEELYKKFRDRLFKDTTSFFTEKIVVVPSLAMKRWLSLRLARDEKAGAAFNIKFLYLSNSVPSKMPGKLELALRIQVEILKNKDLGKWPDLYDYLKLHKGTKKLIPLCFETASLFLQYAQTSQKMIDEWIDKPSSWQACLWYEIFQDKNPYRELVEDTLDNNLDKQVHLFCLSFIPKIHLSYFEKRKYPVYIYALSPTAYFWTDLRSRSEAAWILNFFKEKNVKEEEQEELLTYLLNTNSLLADFGRVGRKFFSLLEDFDFEVFEKYKIDTALKECYESLVLSDIEEESGNKISLLNAIKTDLLLMKSKDDLVDVPFEAEDDSIQIHASNSRLREIEVLYNILIEKMSHEGIKEEDVLVMAPNIALYAPFIEAVFSNKDSFLDYQILDLKISSQNIVAKGFELFLDLIDSRFSLADLSKLFSSEAFAKKQGFNKDELADIEKFIKLACITWGQDKEHRKRTLSKIYGSMQFEFDESKTWKEGLDFIVKSMIVMSDDTLGVELSQAELLGRLIELIYSLMKDVEFLESITPRSLQEWADILTTILDKYFDGNKDEVLHCISTLSRLKFDELFTFDTLLYYLKERLTEESAICFDNKVSAVRFCSLLPMRAIPAKIVCLLGVDEGAFPRCQKKNPFDERSQRKDCDYLPTSGEYDRYLFLEALLSARQTLILSYSKSEQSTSLNPSELVKDIISYALDVHGVTIPHTIHPLDPFNKVYFDGRIYPSRYFDLAKAYFEKNKESLVFPIDNFFIKEPPAPIDSVIDIKELNELVKKPLKFYIEKVLNLKLSLDEKKENLEPLLINSLHLYQIKRGALKHSLDRILDVSERRKILPPGGFGEVAKNKIKELVTTIQDNLKNFSIDPDTIETFYFEENCRQLSSFKKMTVCPKITLNLDHGPVSIIGRVEDVSPLGLISIRKNSFEDLIKDLPKFLIYQVFQEDRSPTDIFLCTEGVKKNIFNAKEILTKLLSYLSLCKANPSPLMPKSVKGFLEGSLKVKDDEYDPYLDLIDKDRIQIEDRWQHVAFDLFDDIYRQWYGK